MTKINHKRRSASAFKAAALTTTALVGFGLPSGALAQDWTGASSSSWFTSSNWSTNAVPTATTDATIEHVSGTNFSPRISGLGNNAVARKLILGQAAVGNQASAGLVIQDGATLTTDEAVIGDLAGSSGNVDIGGVGGPNTSYWTNGGSLIIGNSGAGSLFIGKAVVTSGSGILGANAGSNGGVALIGSDAHWVNNGSLTVGGAGGGSLAILNGATVSSSVSLIGDLAGSVGTVMVAGPNSTWTTATDLVVGANGQGALQVSDQATVSANLVIIGNSGTGSGEVTVDGAGSELNATDDIYVGYNAAGSISVTNGGKVASVDSVIGVFSTGGIGEVHVDGIGSRFANSGALRVGYGGQGRLIISGGAYVNTTTLGIVGELAGSSGKVTVTGSGSTWDNSLDLVVGGSGEGVLSLEGGSFVNADSLVIGMAIGGTGNVAVDGAVSRILTTGDIDVGNIGSGTLTITGGGTVINAGTAKIGAEFGSIGTVGVSGLGSSWANAGSLYVGYDGAGSLNISDAGQVNAGFTALASGLDSTGALTVDGADSAFNGSSNLTIGSLGSGSMSITNAAKVFNTVGTIGAMAGSDGVVTVDGTNSAWLNSGLLFIGDSGDAVLNIINGASVLDSFAFAAVSDDAATAQINVDGAGSSWITGGATVLGVNGTATLNITNGAFVATGASVAGTAGILGASADSHGIASIEGAGSAWNVAGELWIGQAGNGDLALVDGGSVTAAGGIRIAQSAGSTGNLSILGSAGAVIAPTVQFGAGNGHIYFDHTNSAYSFSANISGLGTIVQDGGVTHLTGNSSAFTGFTFANAGSLFVDGQLGGAVAVTGTLGGTGTINGLVDVYNGGTLLGVQGQTLTMGTLTLHDGASVDATFNTSGGSTLFNVTNSLTLDGTLNLTAGGAFGPGVYALMTYGGVLTDNGLDIGTVPVGSLSADYVVQTSVAGQVNLFNNAIPTYSFWDGDAAGSANNNAIDGGSGVWSATSTNFTNVSGSTNGSMYPQPGFAIFQGTGGAVTVDGSAGAIAVTGMQFASDGYSLAGDTITLADADSIIRVGDGSAAGAGFITGIDSVLTGAGGLDKTDLGTLVLTGANTYTGGTTVSGGTLTLGEGGATGSIVGNVTLAGTLAFNRSDVTSFGGSIQGGGQLEQNGSGTTNLTNANNTIGNVVVSNGALGVTSGGTLTTGTIYAAIYTGENASVNVIGANSKLATTSTIIGGAGSGTLAVTNGGTVSSNFGLVGVQAGSNSAAIVSGVGSTWANASNMLIGSAGSGSLTIANGGTVTVGGQMVLANFAGSTGSLNIGAAVGSAATASGALGASTVEFGLGTGTVNFNHTNANYIFGTALTGAGAINQFAGNTNLTGNSSGFTGAVHVNGGRLAVNGSLVGGQVTVGNGGTLGGNGTIGSLTAQSGSIVAPGNSIGTLNIAGNASFGSGSTYQVELTSTGQADLINVAGSVNIANGALLTITKTDAAPYALGTHYNVLTAAGGVNGAYAFNNIQLTNFIGLVAGSDATHIYLDVAKTKSFTSAGGTTNEKATGAALDTLPILGALSTAVANLPNDASAQAAFNQLSGEIHSSAKGVLIEESRFVRDAALDRLRGDVSAKRERFGAWGRVFGSWGQTDSDGNAASVDHDSNGILMGADAMVGETWQVGVVGGYSQSTFDSDARNAAGSSDNYNIGAYAGSNWGKASFRTGLAHSWHDVSTNRVASLAGFANTLAADYKADTTQAFGELGYAVTAGRVSYEPFATLAYVSLSTDGFAETGGVAALTGKGDKTSVTYATLGSRAASTFTLGNGWKVKAQGSLGWRHAFGDTTPQSANAFSTGSAFNIAGAPVANNAAVLNVSLDMNVSKNATLGLSYDGQYGSGSSDHAARATLVVKF